MEFKFDFPKPAEDNLSEYVINKCENNCNSIYEKESFCIENDVELNTNIVKVPECQYKVHNIKFGNYQLSYADVNDVLAFIEKIQKYERINLTIQNHTDLIPGVYEGGLKIWECSLDLITYLNNNNIIKANNEIFDLGCGSGLVGIFAYLKDAKVDFQDYNEEVLKLLTIRNVLLNTENQDIKLVSEKCRFFAGDWEVVGNYLMKNNLKYDLILTSETIYNQKNQNKLLWLMKNILKPSGQIYLAAKTYYFGVGGGIRQFEETVKKDGVFDIDVCQIFNEDIQREILQLKFKEQEDIS